VDPELDTPAVLRRFGRDRRLEPPAWLLLTGAPAEVEVVTRRYGVGVRRTEGRVAPDCVVVLVDAGGTLRARYGAETLGEVGAGVEALLAEGGGK
jgi:cytochrome oxidase Cu insertion factor (SCO1/SenC/PrrC family)